MNKKRITMQHCISLAALFVAATFATGAIADDNRHKAIMSMNPSAYWPLDERAIQQPVRDAAGRDDDGFIDGVRIAQPGSAPGRLSMTFGVVPGINLVDTSAAVQGNGARTVIAWIKTTYFDAQAVFASGTPDVAQAFNLVVGYSGCASVGLMGWADDFYPCGAFLADGAWHMIAATYDGAGSLNLYADGVLDASTFIGYNTTGQNNYIGRSNHEGFEFPFRGSIENVATFRRALSGAEIAKLAGS